MLCIFIVKSVSKKCDQISLQVKSYYFTLEQIIMKYVETASKKCKIHIVTVSIIIISNTLFCC